jgi:hypothetical protein
MNNGKSILTNEPAEFELNGFRWLMIRDRGMSVRDNTQLYSALCED